MESWRERVERELRMAEAARARGNEGMARVCARRVAGWTAQAYLAEKGVDLQTTSAIKHIKHLLDEGKQPPETNAILEHMLVAKQKDDLEADSYFPLDVDLVAEARQLIDVLLP